ncbi:14255_t:CDS:2 [Entrophospora sp. SA101]|nr:14255_t:CDS:2 [Entrophospora sp. SA101]
MATEEKISTVSIKDKEGYLVTWIIIELYVDNKKFLNGELGGEVIVDNVEVCDDIDISDDCFETML